MSASLTQRLAALAKQKVKKEASSRRSKADNAEFKQMEARTYAAMEQQEVESMKVRGVLYSTVEKVDGYVEDRAEFIDYALRQDAGLAEFLHEITYDRHPDTAASYVEAFFSALKSTELVTYKEDGERLNAIARAHIDDGAPMPPGVNFRPKNYISHRKS